MTWASSSAHERRVRLGAEGLAGIKLGRLVSPELDVTFVKLRKAPWLRVALHDDSRTLSVSFARRAFERLHSVSAHDSSDGIRVEVVVGVPQHLVASAPTIYSAQAVIEYADIVFERSIEGLPILQSEAGSL